MNFQISFGKEKAEGTDAQPCPVCESSSIFVANMSGKEEKPYVCLDCKSSFTYRGSELVSVDVSGLPDGCIAVYSLEEL